jgi:hypothetical protein
MEAGTFDVLGTETKPADQKAALISVLADKTPAQQLKVLANNNLTFGPLKGSLIGAASEGLSATYNEETVIKALETYKLAKPFGSMVVNNHTDETTRAFFEAIITLETFGTETSDAIRQVNLSSQADIDVNARYNTVKAAVDAIIDKSVTSIFGFDFSGERVENRPYLQQNIEKVAKIYLGMGTLSAEDAVEKAAEDVISTHINLRGQLTAKSPSFPVELEKMIDLAAEDFVKQNPEYDIDEISLFPAPGRVDEYFVMQNGVVVTGTDVNVYTLEDLQALREQDKAASDEELVQRNLVLRGLTEPQQIRAEIQQLNREASALTGGALSRIRREQGEDAVQAAIAEREAKLARAQQLSDILKEMQD